MKNIIITGSDGQLASDIIKELKKHNDYNVYTFNRKQLDVTNFFEVEKTFDKFMPDVWIQLASYHVVEQINNNPVEACNVNIASLHVISNLCNKNNCTLINFSTNYVFDGKYMPTENYDVLEHYNEYDHPNPVNLYGILKYAGERVVTTTANRFYNIRVSGLFSKQGSRAKNGKSFPSIIIDSLKEKGYAEVVSDQTINLTYTPTAAYWVEKMIRNEDKSNYGTYHLVNRGKLSWYDAAIIIGEALGRVDDIKEINTKDFYTNISRPIYTPLNPTKIEKTFGDGEELPHIKDDLYKYLIEIGEIV